jgi:glycosyltransferase involved in cell wall biosynthesis
MRRAFDTLHRSRVKELTRGIDVDHVFYPWFLGEPVPATNMTPCTMLVLDRNWTRFPNNFAQPPRELDSLLNEWMLRATNVIAISREVATDIKSNWPGLTGKITVIPLAASAETSPAQLSPSDEACFYYPATVSLHKGHAKLLQAAEIVAERGLHFKLLLTGHGTDTLAGKASAAQVKLFKTGIVQGLGYTDLQTVERCYLRAWAVLLPSLYEGFGLPLAESIAHGTSVICSDLAAYREQIDRLQVSDFIKIVATGDSVALADAMVNRIVEGPPTPEERACVARAAGRWTWRDVAVAYNTLLCGSN